MIYQPMGQTYADIDIMSDTEYGKQINQEYDFLRTTSADDMLPYIESQRTIDTQIASLESQLDTKDPSLISKAFASLLGTISGKPAGSPTVQPGTAAKPDYTPVLLIGGIGAIAVILLTMRG